MEQRSLVQAKAFGATHASVSQVDNAKGLSEVQPAIGANRPVAVGPAAVAPLHSIAPVHHGVHAPLAHAVHAAPVAVAHAVHAPVAHTPVSAAVAPVNYGANKPVQGEHRSTTQSKAFGSHAAVVADAPNRLHGAKGVVAHAVHAPVVAHAAAPVAVLG